MDLLFSMKAVKFYLGIILMLLFCQTIGVFFFTPVVQAAEEGASNDIRNFQLKVPIPELSLGTVKEVPCMTAAEAEKKGIAANAIPQCLEIPWLVKYIQGLYRYGVIFGSFVAVVMLMVGGLMYMTAGLNPQMVSRSREYITGAVTGLALLLGTYIFLNTVNPNLVKLQPVKVEIVKEVKNTEVTYCSELDPAKYTITGSSVCGEKMTFKSKDPKVNDSGECLGDVCTDPKQKCVPVTTSPVSPYKCQTVLVWGSIKDPVRYLEEICLYSVSGNKIDPVYCEKYGRGMKSYKITGDMLDMNKLNVSTNAILKITLVDTGRTDLSVTYGDKAGQVLSQNAGSATTFDDDYYVGRAKDDAAIGSKTYIGRWINPECTTCVVKIRRDSGELKGSATGAWSAQPGCKYFSVLEMKDGGIRVDIDSGNFMEDEKIDCKESGGNISPGFAVGQLCGEDPQCASNDCEEENGEKQCECNQDSDCPQGSHCQTSYATWNRCVTKNKVGDPCTEDDQCTSDACSNNVCVCDADNDCPSQDQICKSGKCVNGVPIGGLCNNNDDCIGDADCDTDHWYSVGPTQDRCQCTNDSQCGKGKKCITVERDCGWNYCISDRGGTIEPVASVLEDYNPWDDPRQADKSKGLCGVNADCISQDCDGDWGFNNCSACKQ